jgi:hypothetical protein
LHIASNDRAAHFVRAAHASREARVQSDDPNRIDQPARWIGAGTEADDVRLSAGAYHGKPRVRGHQPLVPASIEIVRAPPRKRIRPAFQSPLPSKFV